MTAAPEQPLTVTEPGVYDMPNEVYHSDPMVGGSLSSTGARKLLPPSCPAMFKWEQDNPPAPKAHFDQGHAVHDALLGGGPEIAVVPEKFLAINGAASTKSAKAFIADVRARGAVPIMPSVDAEVRAMVAAVHEHPVAARLLDPNRGTAEASLFWRDEQSGVNRRARLDILPNQRPGRMVIPDYKSAVSADPDKWAKAAMDHGYHQQAPYYMDAVEALDMTDDPAFVFIVQEKTPPYLVSVLQLDAVALRIGRHLNRRALDIYAECTSTGVWPGHTETVTVVSLPAWFERQFEEEI